MFLRVEQNMRCANLLGRAIAIAVDGVKLAGASDLARPLGVERRARGVINLRHTQLREHAVAFVRDARRVDGIRVELLALCLTGERLAQQHLEQQVADALVARHELGAHLGRNPLELGFELRAHYRGRRILRDDLIIRAVFRGRGCGDDEGTQKREETGGAETRFGHRGLGSHGFLENIKKTKPRAAGLRC